MKQTLFNLLKAERNAHLRCIINCFPARLISYNVIM